jgi:hypothetical protein
MSTNTTPLGAQGCPCEDCLGDLIIRYAGIAACERHLMPLWARQERFRVRLASDGMLRRVS